jgi:putative phage-type endonuclease
MTNRRRNMGAPKLNIIADTRSMTRADWLKHRRKGLGGSDAGAIAGVNPWKKPIHVYLDKRGELPEDEELSEAAYWGIQLEDMVGKEFKKRNGLWIQKKNALLQHPKHEFMLANLDREVFDKDRGRGGLEIKTASAYLADDWKGDRIPDSYNLQVQHYMAVTGYDYFWMAVLIGGQKYHQIIVERDEELIDLLIETEAKFWEQIKAGEPPALDGSNASSELLKKLYPEENGKIITIPEADAVDDLVAELKQWKSAEKEAREGKKATENQLKAMVGENLGAIAGEHYLEFKTTHRGGYEVQPSSYRSLKIKKAAKAPQAAIE